MMSNNQSVGARSPWRLALAAGLAMTAAVSSPAVVQGQFSGTPVSLQLPMVLTEAYDCPIGCDTSRFPALNYGDDSDLLPLVNAQSVDGGATGEAMVALTDWARAMAPYESTSAAAMYWLEITVEDPQDRPEIKTVLDFKAAASAPVSGAASVFMVLGASDNQLPAVFVRDDLTLSGWLVPQVVHPRLLSMAAEVGSGGAGSTIYMNYQLVSQKGCECRSISDGGSLALTHAPGRYLVVVGAQATHGVAIADPVLRPHPDNPDVIVTRHAPAAPLPRGPLTGITPEDLTAIGIDPTPFAEMGFFDPPAPSDATAPTTAATAVSQPSVDGWHRGPVTVSLAAADDPGGSGVREIHFALSGASTGAHVVAGANATAQIAAEGHTTMTYFAVDQAGNQEPPKTLTVKIDSTPPVITGMPAAGCTIWPPDHRLVSVAAVTAVDPLSGLGSLVPTVSATSSEPDVDLGDAALPPDIVINGSAVQVRAERNGTGTGRIYTIDASAIDRAGNQATATATCTVPHDAAILTQP